MLHMPCPTLMSPSAGIFGQQLFTASGTFIVPEGVTSICAVAIGAGSNGISSRSGAGGALSYANAIAVTPGETLDVIVRGSLESNSGTRVQRSGSDLVAAGAAINATPGAVIAGTGFSGGAAATNSTGSARNGAGAGGYTGAGQAASPSGVSAGFGGGGSSPYGGGPGADQGVASNANGLNYGGGGGKFYVDGTLFAGLGGPGAARIIWGEGRAFPNTNTGDV